MNIKSIHVTLLLCVIGVCSSVHAQFQDEHGCILMPGPYMEPSYIPPPKGLGLNQSRSLEFEIEYTEFLLEAIEPFEYAISIWAGLLDSDVPIRIDASMSEFGGLGFGGSLISFNNFPGALEPDVNYPTALANKLAGVHLNNFISDISVNFNTTIDWYYGIDGACPPDKYDFVSVALHEIGHGLGFASGTSSPLGGNPIGYIESNPGGYVNVFDTYIHTWQGVPIASIEHGTEEMYMAFIDSVYFISPRIDTLESELSSLLQYNYPFLMGYSLSHWFEEGNTVTTSNSLMTPLLAPGQAVHDPGPMTLALLEDIGWGNPVVISDVEEIQEQSIKVFPNPMKEYMQIHLGDSFSQVRRIEIFNSIGKLVKSYSLKGNERLITIERGQLSRGIYIAVVKSTSRAESISFSVE